MNACTEARIGPQRSAEVRRDKTMTYSKVLII